MQALTLAFIITALAAGYYMWICRRSNKTGGLGLAGLLLCLYLGLTSVMGWPAPLGVPQGEVRVLGVHLDEGVAIYVLLLEEGQSEPRAYRLPWSLAMARQQREAGREAEAEGLGLRIRLGGQSEGRGVFYKDPPQPSPPKRME